jgi:FkbM family methyltransferase
MHAILPSRTRLLFVGALLTVLQLSSATTLGGEANDILTSGTKLYSQLNEELIIRHFFNDRKNGFFVDVGCYHWKIHSTTYYLEKHLGWSGMGIDALPQLAQGYAEHRPRTSFFNYIVTDRADGFETLYTGGAVSSTSKEWVETFLKDGAREQIQVSTITLTEFLDRHGITKIDFLSIDIEGGEPKALAGFDIERFRPELVAVETAGGNATEIGTYFKRHGYERIEKYLQYDKVNSYYRPKAAAATE